MTKEEMYEQVVKVVNEHGPIKATTIPVQLTGFLPEFDITILDELVALGKIIEVEYVLPKMNYRAKSMYFPAGTELRIIES